MTHINIPDNNQSHCVCPVSGAPKRTHTFWSHVGSNRYIFPASYFIRLVLSLSSYSCRCLLFCVYLSSKRFTYGKCMCVCIWFLSSLAKSTRFTFLLKLRTLVCAFVPTIFVRQQHKRHSPTKTKRMQTHSVFLSISPYRDTANNQHITCKHAHTKHISFYNINRPSDTHKHKWQHFHTPEKRRRPVRPVRPYAAMQCCCLFYAIRRRNTHIGSIRFRGTNICAVYSTTLISILLYNYYVFIFRTIYLMISDIYKKNNRAVCGTIQN